MNLGSIAKSVTSAPTSVWGKIANSPLTSTIVAGGASLLGGFMSNTASAKQASKQMDFQEYMSNTAHQREVADLKAAGLNPILSGTGGHGASSPPGAMAAQSDIISPAVASAQRARALSAELELTHAQTEQADSSANLNAAAAGKAEAERNLAERYINESNDRSDKIQEDTRTQRALTVKAQNDAEASALAPMMQQYLLSSAKSKSEADQHQPAIQSSEAARARNTEEFEKSLGGDIAPFARFLLEMIRGIKR